jgi:hypothetical protein
MKEQATHSSSSTDNVLKMGPLPGKWQYVGAQPVIYNPEGASGVVRVNKDVKVNWIVFHVDKDVRYYLEIRFKKDFDANRAKLSLIPNMYTKMFIVSAMLNTFPRLKRIGIGGSFAEEADDWNSNIGLVLIGNVPVDEPRFFGQVPDYAGLPEIKRDRDFGFIFKQYGPDRKSGMDFYFQTQDLMS